MNNVPQHKLHSVTQYHSVKSFNYLSLTLHVISKPSPKQISANVYDSFSKWVLITKSVTNSCVTRASLTLATAASTQDKCAIQIQVMTVL